MLLVMLVVFAGGCAWRVIPPAGVEEPVAVHLTDYGRHTRLALPMDEDTMHEYGFGEWHYYGLENRGFFSTLRAVSGFGKATLAFRPLPRDEDLFSLYVGGRRTVTLFVEKERVRELRESLETRWYERRDERIHRERENLHFVPVDDRYHLFRNSNHKTAEWLSELGFEVRGFPILSNFRVREEER